MLKFDPQTLQSWKEKNIEFISIEFIPSGCEWTSIKIHENIILEEYQKIESLSIDIYASSLYHETLSTAYITHTGNKWIMKSESVLTRCGCGKSFGIKTWDPKIDKIRLLKSKLAKSKWIHH